MAKEKVIEFPFRDGVKEVKVGDTVAFTNGNRNRGKTIFTDKIKKFGRTLMHLEEGRSFYIETGREKAEVCGSEIFSSEEAVVRMKKVEKMRHKLGDAFNFSFRFKEEVTPEKVEQCYEIIFGEWEEDGIN